MSPTGVELDPKPSTPVVPPTIHLSREQRTMSTQYGSHVPEPQPTVPPVVVQMVQPRKRTHHVLHALLTVLTGGAWGIVWIVQTLRHNTH